MVYRVPAFLLLAAASLPAQSVLTIGGAGGIANESYSTAISTSGGTTLSLAFNVDYLVVAGGGAGGTAGGGSGGENTWGAGGGGAGGVLTGFTFVNAQSYTVRVGAGGAAANYNEGSTANGGSGTNSVFGGFEAFGGGGGAGGINSSSGGAGLTGGSGGGGGGDGLKPGGSGTSEQGFGGGTSRTSAGNRAAGGGGGGASEVGQIGGPPNGHNSGVGGRGGAGLASSITGSSVTYGGGGGGGGRDINGGATSAGGDGGDGGGGAGSGRFNATSGTDGLGGGGGGSGADGKGGDGGDGIVIVRYKGSSAGTGGTIASGTGSAAGHTIHTFSTVGDAALNLSSLNLNGRLGSVVSSSVSGTGALNVDTQGTVVFTGSATHTGGTNLVAGNLILGNGGTSGSLGGDVSVSSGAWLQYDRSANATFSSLTGAGNLVKMGTGVLTLAGGTAFTGEVEVQAGRLQIGNSGALSTGALKLNGGGLSSDGSAARTISSQIIVYGSGPLGNATNNGTLTLTGGVVLNSEVSTLALASDVVISSSLSGGGLIKTGPGALTLSGDNSAFSGDIGLGVSFGAAGGALRVGSSNALGSGSLVIQNSGGSISSDGTTARTIANAIRFADWGYGVTLGDATRNGALTLTGDMDLASTGGTLTVLSDVTISGTLSNAAGSFVKSGGGTLTLSGANGSLAPSMWLTIDAGKVRMGSADALGTTRLLLRGGALTSVGGAARQISQEIYFQGNVTLGDATDNGALTLAGNVSFASGTHTVTVNSDVAILGSLRDGNLIKAGSAKLTLSGDSTIHTGQITVDAGTLVANGTLGSSFVYVASGATLAGSGTIAGDTVITGVHTPGNSPGVQTFGADLSYTTGSSITWELGANSESNSPAVVFDRIVVGQDLSFELGVILALSFNPSEFAGTVDWSDAFWLADRSWQIFEVAGATDGLGNVTLSTQDWLDAQGDSFDAVLGGSFSLSQSGSDIYLTYSAIPEPSTYGLILGGLALVGAAVRRRRAKRA